MDSGTPAERCHHGDLWHDRGLGFETTTAVLGLALPAGRAKAAFYQTSGQVGCS